MINNYGQAKQAFFESAERQMLEAPHCNACHQFFFYPRPFCPHCWSEDVEFRLVSGFGSIWSYTVVRFAHGNAVEGRSVPYAVALIELDEGIRLMGNVVDCPLDNLRSAMRVALRYEKVGDRVLPAWAPA